MLPFLSCKDAAPPPEPPPPPPAQVERTLDLAGLGPVRAIGPQDPAAVTGVAVAIGAELPADPHLLRATVDVEAWKGRVRAGKGACWYPPGELETAAQQLEQAWSLPTYFRPIVVGRGWGADVVYASIATAPEETFAGGVAEGLCPAFDAPKKLCSRPGFSVDRTLPPAPKIPTRPDGAPRLAVVDPCPDADALLTGATRAPDVASAVRGFVPVVASPDGSRPPDDLARRLDALGLPLSYEWGASPRRVLIFVSGDGGWADLDRSLASALAQRGIAVVGLSSLSYFWVGRDRDGLTRDVQRIVDQLPEQLPVAIGGYSFGADTAPFALLGLGPRVDRLVILGPSQHASWRVDPVEMLTGSPSDQDRVPDAIRAAERPTLCIRPEVDDESGCPAGAPGVEVLAVPGGHHFGGDYDRLAERIAAFLDRS
jgi:type IV secretory pathway VirJ component